MKKLGLFFFFLMLVVPTTLQVPRGLLLMVLLTGAGLAALKRGFRFDPWILGFTLVCVTASTLFITWGAFNHAPGALRVGTVYVLWPLVYLVFIGVMSHPRDWKPYVDAISVSTVVAVAMILAILAEAAGFLAIPAAQLLEFLDAGVALYEGIVEFNLVTTSTLLFAVPFLIAKVVGGYSRERPLMKFIEAIALLGGLVALMFSGKRALWVVVALSPFIALVMMRAYGARLPVARLGGFAAIILVALGTAAVAYELDPVAIWDDFAKGFDFAAQEEHVGAWRRKEQFFALLAGWEASPLFGAGHGGPASDKFGLEEESFAYELSYVALLFHVGLVGVVIYALPLAWLYYRSIKLMREDPTSRAMMAPLLVGMTGFLIANATNPYLEKFDYLWVIFLPAAVPNSYLVTRRRRPAPEAPVRAAPAMTAPPAAGSP